MARRVNKKFLIILTAVIVGLGASAYVAQRLLRKPLDPVALLTKADQLEKEGRDADALQFIDTAVMLRKDPDLLVRRAKMRIKLRELNQDYIPGAIRDVEDALLANPSHLAALQLKVEFSYERLRALRARGLATKANFEEYRQVANRRAELLGESSGAAAKERRDAELLAHSAMVEQLIFILNPDGSLTITDDEIDRRRSRLSILLNEDPTDARPAQLLSRIAAMRARSADLLGQSETATAKIREARQILQNVIALPGNNTNHQALYLAYEGYRFVMEVVGRRAATLSRAASTRPMGLTLDEVNQMVLEADLLLADASRLVTPKDENYLEIKLAMAVREDSKGNFITVEAELRDLLKQRPGAPRARIMLARTLAQQPKRIQEAVDFLNESLTAGPVVFRADIPELRILRARLLMERQRATTQPTEKQALKDDVERSLVEIGVDTPEGKRLRGIHAFLQEQYKTATTILEEFVADHDAKQLPPTPEYREALAALARSHIKESQLPAARKFLQRQVEIGTDRATVISLIEVTLALQAGTTVNPTVQFKINELIDSLVPKGGNVILTPEQEAQILTLRIRNLDPTKEGDRKQAADYIAKLPETTREERFRKGALLLQFRHGPEALRVFELDLASDPHFPDTLQYIAFGVHIGLAGEAETAKAAARDKAVAFLENALKDAPPDRQMIIKNFIERAKGNLENVRKIVLPEILKLPDGFDKSFLLAEYYIRNNDMDTAVKHLKQALVHKPKEPETCRRLFQILINARVFNEAQDILKILIEIDADSFGGKTYEIALYTAQGNSDKAIALAKELAEKNPQIAVLKVAYGQTLSGAERYDEAKAQFEAALQLQNRNPQAWIGLIDAQLRSGNYAEYVAATNRAAQLLPNNGRILQIKTAADIDFGTPAEVKKAIEIRYQLVKANPADPELRRGLVTGLIRAAQRAEEAADRPLRSEWLKQTIAVLDDAITAFPDDITFYALKADVQLATQDREGAEATIMAIRKRPLWERHAQPYVMLFELYSRLRWTDKALNAINNAMLLCAPELRDPLLVQKANLLISAGNYDEALKSLPADAESLAVFGTRMEVLRIKGQINQAKEELEARLKLRPDDHDGRVALARTYLEIDESPTALKIIDQLIKRIEPQAAQSDALANTYARAVYVRGLIHFAGKPRNIDLARADFRRVLEINPEHGDATAALARVLRESPDQYDAAITEMERAVARTPLRRQYRMEFVDWVLAARPPQYSRAIDMLEKSLRMEQFRNDVDMRIVLANVYATDGKAAKAIENARAVLGLEKSPRAMQVLITVLLQTGRYDELLKEADAVAELMEKANKRSSETRPATDTSDENRVWWIYHARGIAHARLAKKDKAVDDFSAALDIATSAGDDFAVQTIITSLLQEINIADALKIIRPRKDERWRLIEGNIHLAQFDSANAMKVAVELEKKLPEYEAKLQPDSQTNPQTNPADAEAKAQAKAQAKALYINVLQYVATAYMLEATPSSVVTARKYFDTLLRIDPDNVVALNNIAFMLIDIISPPQPAEALRFSKQAVEILRRANRDIPNIRDTHARVLALNGQVDEAIQILLDVDGILKTSPEVLFHLGEAWAMKKNWENAVIQLEKANKLLADAQAAGRPYNKTLQAKVKESLEKARVERDKDLPPSPTPAPAPGAR